MLEEDLEVAIKVVVVGNGAVGKSSMIQRYCKGIFTKDYKKTIGVDFLEREMQYLADKYLQKLKQRIMEDPEVVHTSSNRIGVFNTAGGSHSGQNSNLLNGSDVINLRPNKQRTKKSRSPFSSCSIP